MGDPFTIATGGATTAQPGQWRETQSTRCHCIFKRKLNIQPESAEYKFPMQNVRCLNRSRVKQMTSKIDTCYYLAWHSALQELGKDWLAQ